MLRTVAFCSPAFFAAIAPAMRPADVGMVAVQDARIAEVASAFAAAKPSDAIRPIVFHCSGARNAGSLQPLSDPGWRTARAHCIWRFAKVAAAVKQFPGTACALEGGATACAVLAPAFQAIGSQCCRVVGEDKVRYHAAAVFATKFQPVLQPVADAARSRSGVPAKPMPTGSSVLRH
jgi:predicted short-subunit dehydrogenase-like oxidoreductase (DUF2520 family)